MNYLDFNEEIKNLNPANLQPLLPQTTTAVAAAAAAASCKNVNFISDQKGETRKYGNFISFCCLF